MKNRRLSDYVGSEQARILEECGYRSREDIMAARIFDLLLLGSFSDFSLVRMLVKLYAEEHPRSKIDLDDLFDTSVSRVTVFGLDEYDDPPESLKKITVRELCVNHKLSAQKIVTLVKILHNGTVSKARQDAYYEYLNDTRRSRPGWDEYE